MSTERSGCLGMMKKSQNEGAEEGSSQTARTRLGETSNRTHISLKLTMYDGRYS
jgi:hypothetical protein